MTEIIPPELESTLKQHREEMSRCYAQLIANPYRAQSVLDEMRGEIVKTAVTLMEHRIPLEIPKKPRTLTDVLQEAAAEAGMMLGSNAVASGVSFFRNVKEQVNQKAEPLDEEEFLVYEDEEGNFFYIDDDGNEVDCDRFGNEIQED